MKTTKILFSIGIFISFAFLVALFIAGFLFVAKTQNKIDNPINKINASNLENLKLDLAEISKHNTLSDCWMIIDQKVYDITSYSSSHPGGTGEIDLGCGKDATSLYDTKGGKGNTHSSYANSLLVDYYIGDLNSIISSQDLQNKTSVISNLTKPSNNREDDEEENEEEDD
jgi:cytochrome b involved in lipid metabolism